jgi:hypothetical protein
MAGLLERHECFSLLWKDTVLALRGSELHAHPTLHKLKIGKQQLALGFSEKLKKSYQVRR